MKNLPPDVICSAEHGIDFLLIRHQRDCRLMFGQWRAVDQYSTRFEKVRTIRSKGDIDGSVSSNSQGTKKYR